jgi:ATP-dependent protease ClpP protease subunit
VRPLTQLLRRKPRIFNENGPVPPITAPGDRGRQFGRVGGERRLDVQANPHCPEAIMSKFTNLRHILLGATAVASLALSAVPSHAGLIERYSAGQWEGEAYTNEQTGAFSHCVASARFQNGMILGFVLNAQNAWSIALGYPSWQMARGGNFNIQLAVNKAPALAASGVAITEQTVEFPVEAVQDVLTRIAQGTSIDISANAAAYHFDVENMRDTLVAVRACADRHGVKAVDGRRAAPTDAPPQPQPVAAPMQPQPVAAPQQPAPAPQARPQQAPQSSPALPEMVQKSISHFLTKDGELRIGWNGPVVPGMTEAVQKVFSANAQASHRIVFFLNSPGGSIEEGERTIHLLQEIRKTHQLVTAVMHDGMCASMCVPIYLQGLERVAAPTSRWVIHEAAHQVGDDKVKVDPEETMRIFRRYYVQAGVSEQWLAKIVQAIHNGNLWFTGQELFSEHTGIVSRLLDNRTVRADAIPETKGELATN